MIDALVGGKLFKAAEERRSQAGKTFVTANIRAADGEGEGLFISVVAFNDSAKAALLAMEEGDSVSLAGTLKIGTYEARDGSVKASVSMVAQNVMSAYQVSRKRKAAAETDAKTDVHPGVKQAERLYGRRDAMNDSLEEPF